MKEKDFLPLVEEKYGITEINPMQRRMLDEAGQHHDIILLSPTGSGKTLAFVMPILKLLKPASGRLQVAVIAPGRELVVQTAQVFRDIAQGYKTVALYGGHNVQDETQSLQAGLDIVVATPGRLLDHAKRHNIDLRDLRILVLDEFDKCLELGFETEMKKLLAMMKNVSRTILTSATDLLEVPGYVNISDPLKLSYVSRERHGDKQQRIHRAEAAADDKLESLQGLLASLAEGQTAQKTIIFANYRESAQRIYDYLKKAKLPVGLYHGALDQHEREIALRKFDAGSTPILVATDLAARGLDIARVQHIIHYHQPLTPEAWTHRNGRTGRGDSAAGDIYVLTGPNEDVKDFVTFTDTYHYDTQAKAEIASDAVTLYFHEGRKDKLSKGDILGFLVKQGGLEPASIGRIDVFDRYALATIECQKPQALVKTLNTMKIKGRKVRISLS